MYCGIRMRNIQVHVKSTTRLVQICYNVKNIVVNKNYYL